MIKYKEMYQNFQKDLEELTSAYCEITKKSNPFLENDFGVEFEFGKKDEIILTYYTDTQYDGIKYNVLHIPADFKENNEKYIKRAIRKKEKINKLKSKLNEIQSEIFKLNEEKQNIENIINSIKKAKDNFLYQSNEADDERLAELKLKIQQNKENKVKEQETIQKKISILQQL